MTRRCTLLLVLITAFTAATPLLPAQSRQTWVIAQYAPDLAVARQEIRARLANNYVPMGMEVDEALGISVLYVDAPVAARIGIRGTDVRLRRFAGDDPEALEAGVNSLLSDGWFPVDISRTEAFYYVLAINSGWRVEQWRFAYDMFTSARMQAAIELFQEDGLELAGMGLYEGVQAWYLFVQSPDWRPRQIYFTSYLNETDALVAGFNEDMAEGWIPVGFAVGTTAITVFYVR
ncbi:MAG: hypothetical protein EA403_15720 [Spirochaetaceae bacterium]|nr:MAG: hypothetical protein EA403_15720 [Spirochaetaceae bacterium]